MADYGDTASKESVHLYKFLGSLDSVSYLLQGKVRFTPPKELNDPSELAPLFDNKSVLESLEELRANGYTETDLGYLRQQGALLHKLDPKSMVVRPPDSVESANRIVRFSFYDQSDILQERLIHTTKTMSNNIGIFCLTKTFRSLPMWAHYASNAKGAVVEFERLEREFTGDETGVLSQLIDVDYYQVRPSVTFNAESHKHLFFSKLVDWSYEREVRVLMALSDCQLVERPDSTKLFLYQCKHASVKRVILGWNSDENEIQSRISEWKKINPNVNIERAIFKGETIALSEVQGQSL